MDKEKEGLSTPAQDAIADAAKANVDAVIKVASSAVTAFVDTLTGSTKKSARWKGARKRRLLPHPNVKDKAWKKVRLGHCTPQGNQKSDGEEAHP